MSADVGHVHNGLEGQLALHIEGPVLDGAGTVDLRLDEEGVALPVHDRGVDEGRQLARIGGDLREHTDRGLRSWPGGVRVAGEEALAVILGEASDALGGEVNAVAGANDSVGIDRIGEAHARTEGLFEDRLRRAAAEPSRAAAFEDVSAGKAACTRVRQGRVHIGHAVVRLGHRDWHVVTQAQVDGELVVDLPVVRAKEGKILCAPSVDLRNGNIRLIAAYARECPAIEAGEAEAGVAVSRSAGGALGEVELAGAAGQDAEVELRGAEFAAELEAVTALLPRDRVVILKDVVVEDAVAIAGGC